MIQKLSKPDPLMAQPAFEQRRCYVLNEFLIRPRSLLDPLAHRHELRGFSWQRTLWVPRDGRPGSWYRVAWVPETTPEGYADLTEVFQPDKIGLYFAHLYEDCAFDDQI